MKKFIVMLLASAFLLGIAVPGVYAAAPAHYKEGANKVKCNKELKFKDIKGHWAEKIVVQMNAKGFIKGYQNLTFKPSSVVSQLEAVVMIVRALGLEETAQDTVLSGPVKRAKQIPSWAAGYVQVAYDKGILTKEDVTSFKPNQAAKRIEVALMIARALDLNQKFVDKSVKFLDSNDIPVNLSGVVIIIVDTGIMKGTPGNYFLPNKPITRAEMAVLLDRIDGTVIENEKKEVSGKITSIDDNSITVAKSDKSKEKEYDFSDDVTVYLNGKTADLEDLEEGFYVKIVLNGEGEVTYIEAEEVDEESYQGEITQIVLGTKSKLTIEDGDEENTFKINDSTEIKLDGKEIFLTDLELGWNVTIEARDGVALEINVEDDDD